MTTLTKTQTSFAISTQIRDIGIVLFMNFLICLSAPCTIPLPFTPVPMALQPHIILLFAAVFGPKRAVSATFLFLMEGLMNFPVFAGGTFGIAAFMGPRAGYLIGYVFAAWTTGFLMEKIKFANPSKTFVSMLVGNGVIYLFGLPCLSLFVGIKSALLLGFVPFVLGDLIKIGLLMPFASKKAM